MRSKNIQADSLQLISDGKVRTLQEIANEVEVHRITVYKHIQALSFRYNIETFHGGINRGGVRMITERKISTEKLSVEELELILKQFKRLKDFTPNIISFIHNLTTQKEIKEMEK